MTTREGVNIEFPNGKIARKDQAKHLGCNINQQGDTDKEINKVITSKFFILLK